MQKNWLKITYDEPNNQKLKKLYVGWAKVYDKNMAEWGYAYNKKILKILPKLSVTKKSKILDAGCGTGWVGQTLFNAKYKNLSGIDYSPDMLKQAKKKKIYKKLVCANLRNKIKFPTNTFDIIICVGFLAKGHLGPEVLDELIRILKPNGYIVCSIGENVWKKFKFDKKIKSLTIGKKIKLHIRSKPFVVLPNNEASAKSRMYAIKKIQYS